MKSYELQALFAGATFATAVIASTVGMKQLTAFRRQQVEQSRPYVIVDFFFRQSVICILAQNIGRFPASNVRIRFDPELQSSRADTVEKTRESLARPISMMAPNRRIIWLLDSTTTAFDAKDMNRLYRVDVRYSELGPGHRSFRSMGKKKAREYQDLNQFLDLEQYRRALINDTGMWDLVAAIKDLKPEI